MGTNSYVVGSKISLVYTNYTISQFMVANNNCKDINLNLIANANTSFNSKVKEK